MKNILVTGGAGFIGSHTVERLLKLGRNVICIDNFNDFYNPAIKKTNLAQAFKNENFRLVEGDIRDEKKLQEVFETDKIEAVIHLAAMAGVRQSLENPILYTNVNINGTIKLLEACKNSNLRNFIFGSSSSIYGDTPEVPFREDVLANQPASPYGATKRAGEMICNVYHHLYGIPVSCLRFFTVYGPRQRPGMAIHKFTRLIDEEKEIEVFGEGTKRDYTYIDDIVDGIMSALEKPHDFEIFNLGDSHPVELMHLVSIIEKILGKKAKIKKMTRQPGDVEITYADISKAEKMLGYNPKVSIEEGVSRFVRWYTEQFSRK